MTGLPESTHTGQPTSTSSVTATSGVTASTTSGTSSATSVPATSSGGSSSSNTGAIAGGVVGGVVGLALIAALIFWWMRRSRAQPASVALLDHTPTAPMSPVSPTTFVQTVSLGTTSPRLYVRPSLYILFVRSDPHLYVGSFRPEYIPLFASEF